MNAELTEQTLSVIKSYLHALATRNLEAITHYFGERVDWDVPGCEAVAPWLGKRTSKNEIKEFFQLLWSNTEPVSGNIDHIFVDDNLSVVIGEFSARMLQTGKIYESLFSIHFTIEDNLIVRYRVQEDSYGLVKVLSN